MGAVAKNDLLVVGILTMIMPVYEMKINVPSEPYIICIEPLDIALTNTYSTVGRIHMEPQFGLVDHGQYAGYGVLLEEAVGGAKRSANDYNGFVYADGVLTVPARSAAFNWAAGTYKYTIVCKRT